MAYDPMAVINGLRPAPWTGPVPVTWPQFQAPWSKPPVLGFKAPWSKPPVPGFQTPGSGPRLQVTGFPCFRLIVSEDWRCLLEKAA